MRRHKNLISAVLLLGAAPAAAVSLPSQIFVFGDSLVDSGNINAASGSDFFNPVAEGYFPGRFTNGPNYTDFLNQRVTGEFLTPSLRGGTNFAFGAARIVNNGDEVPDLAFQLGAYLFASGNTIDPNALYIINAGGNDVFGLNRYNFEVSQGVENPMGIGNFGSAEAYTANLLDTLSTSVTTLSALGASRILVTGIPNMDATGFALESLVQARLDTTEPLLGTTQLLRFSYQNFFLALAADPATYGLPAFDKIGNCIGNEPVVNGRIACPGYFSFDGIHPTAEVQRVLYREVGLLTGIVPEPASWAMLIAGFGLVGAVQRRRRTATATVGIAAAA